MRNFIKVERNPPELLKVMPDAGKFRVVHQSPKGQNFCQMGDNRDDLVSKVSQMANFHGLEIEGVEDVE